MGNLTNLKESISYWEKRLKRIDGKRDALRVESVRRQLRLLIDAEISGMRENYKEERK